MFELAAGPTFVARSVTLPELSLMVTVAAVGQPARLTVCTRPFAVLTDGT